MIRVAWTLILFATVGFAGSIAASLETTQPLLPASAAPVPQIPAAAIQDRGAAVWADTTLARPLFSRTRRAPAQTAETSVSPTPDRPARLTGILVTPAGRVAIFATADGGQSMTVQEGGQIGEDTVTAIAGGQVTLSGPAGQRVLSTSFDPAARAAAPPATVLPPMLQNAFPSPARGQKSGVP